MSVSGSCAADACTAGSRRVFNLGIGSLFSYSSRQWTHEDKSLVPDDPNHVPSPETPAIPQMVSGVVREMSYCWRYIAASARACTTAEADEGACKTMGAFFEVLPEDWLALRAREQNYALLPVTPNLPFAEGLPSDAFYFAWGDGSRVNASTGALNEKACPVHPHDVIAPFISQAYWDFILGGILSWDGVLLDSTRYSWDLDAELGHGEEWARRRVAVFPKYSYAQRRAVAVDVVRTTAKSAPTGAKWADDRLCPFTGNAPLTPKSDLRYPQATLGTITTEAVGTVSPISTPLVRAIVDEILNEGGWDVSARESIDCESVAANVPMDVWAGGRNPWWDDIKRWQTANLGAPAAESWSDRLPWWLPLAIVLAVLLVVDVALVCLLLALAKHTGYRLGSLFRKAKAVAKGPHAEPAAATV